LSEKKGLNLEDTFNCLDFYTYLRFPFIRIFYIAFFFFWSCLFCFSPEILLYEKLTNFFLLLRFNLGHPCDIITHNFVVAENQKGYLSTSIRIWFKLSVCMSEIVLMFWTRFFSVNNMITTKPNVIHIKKFSLFERKNVCDLVVH
jgi:hypothetical protein